MGDNIKINFGNTLFKFLYLNEDVVIPASKISNLIEIINEWTKARIYEARIEILENLEKENKESNVKSD